MAFNINEFSSKIQSYGGLARNNTFEVTFSPSDIADPLFSSEFPGSDLRFFCSNVTVPGISLATFDYRPTNVEMPQSIPFAMNHEQLETVFMVDDKHNVLRYFHKWMERVINYNTAGDGATLLTGLRGSDGIQQPYEIGYKNDYTKIMTVRKFSRNILATNVIGESRFQLYTYKFEGVYPVQVGSLNLAWAENDTYTTLPVSFSYSSMKVSLNGEETSTIDEITTTTL